MILPAIDTKRCQGKSRSASTCVSAATSRCLSHRSCASGSGGTPRRLWLMTPATSCTSVPLEVVRKSWLGKPASASRSLTELVSDGSDCRSSLDLGDYADFALTSGFPEASSGLTRSQREIWLESYLSQMLSADVMDVRGGRDPIRLRRYFDVLAANIAGTPTESTLLAAADINRKTLQQYDLILERLFMTERLPAWYSNRLKRLTSKPKRLALTQHSRRRHSESTRVV